MSIEKYKLSGLVPPESRHSDILDRYPQLDITIATLGRVHSQQPLTEAQFESLLAYSVWVEDPTSINLISDILKISKTESVDKVNYAMENLSHLWDIFEEFLPSDYSEEDHVSHLKNWEEEGTERAVRISFLVEKYQLNRKRAETEAFDNEVTRLRSKGLKNPEIAHILKTPRSRVRDAVHRQIVSGVITQFEERARPGRKPETEAFDNKVKSHMLSNKPYAEIAKSLNTSIDNINSSVRRLRILGELPIFGLTLEQLDYLDGFSTPLLDANMPKREVLEMVVKEFVKISSSGQVINLSQIAIMLSVSRQRINFLYQRLSRKMFVPPTFLSRTRNSKLTIQE